MIPKEPAEIVVGFSIIWRHRNCPGEVLQGLCESPGSSVSHAKVVQRLCKAGVALNGHVVELQSLLQVLLLLENDPHVVVGLRAPGIKVNGELVVNQGLVVLVQLSVGHAQVVICICIGWAVNQRLSVASDGTLRVRRFDLQPVIDQRDRQVHGSCLTVWAQPEDCTVPVCRRLVVALLSTNGADIAHGLCGPRIQLVGLLAVLQRSHIVSTC
mmetsp:Transcript_130992/g.310677  ORF Transcript_130992/g.310677 Transcript_130992/m.310677 type:complete len:213 (-) Transcript_130992:249-887(-)